MKKLYLIRHAKSSWDDSKLDDFDRPLNDRGRKDAPRMGKRLKDHKVSPDIVLTSPAVRAMETCQEMTRVLGIVADRIKTDKRLYQAGAKDILAVLRELDSLPKAVSTVMIFSHNPGLTEFANRLLHDEIENVPTCGVVAGEMDIANWSELKWGIGKHLFFDFPKKQK